MGRVAAFGNATRCSCAGTKLNTRIRANPRLSVKHGSDAEDHELYKWIKDIGGFDGVLDQDYVPSILRTLGHDMLESARYFSRTPQGFTEPFPGPLHCIIGEANKLTLGSEHEVDDWCRYGVSVQVRMVEEAGQYFVSTHTQDLVRILGGLIVALEGPLEGAAE